MRKKESKSAAREEKKKKFKGFTAMQFYIQACRSNLNVIRP